MTGAALASAQNNGAPDHRATAFTLGNGLRFILVERHQSPLISFHTYVNAGSVNDPAGQSGLAYLMERMASKGSESIGSRNWPEERKALEALDDAYDRMEAERNKGALASPDELDKLRTHWRLAVDNALRLAQPNEYMKMLREGGATAIKSEGSWNSLEFSYTLPSNKLEFWFAMESQRLIHPVLRDFYKERETLVEEHRPPAFTPQAVQTRVLDTLVTTAFTAHPYRNPANGWAADAAELNRRQATAFVERYFVPGNIVIGMTGDVNPDEAKRLAEKYFGSMPARPMPDPVRTVEPAQPGPRTAIIELVGPAIAAIGYKRPSYLDKDDIVLDLIQDMLSPAKGTGMLYQELVQQRKIALSAQAGASYPDGRYPNLFVFVVNPAPAHSAPENEKALEEVLFKLKTRRVGEEALNQAKARVRSVAYQRLESNATMAQMLALYTSAYGDWKPLFQLIDDYNKVTEEDIMRVAQRYFVNTGRTTAYTAIPGLGSTKTGDGQ
jgi:predicted Zn-dependent peptidase